MFFDRLPSSLESLDLSNNEITYDAQQYFPNLIILDLRNNSLSGHLPPKILNMMPRLKYLYLSNNRITGEMNMILDGHPSSLEQLDLSYNSLHESQLVSLGNLSMLRSLDLRSNNLNGMLPEGIKRLKGLTDLDLYNNSLRLSEDDLANLPKTIPNWLPSGLQYLDLSDNKITGEIPQFFPKLKYLFLSNNSFSGNLSPRITNTMPSLQWFDLSTNNMSGEIPFSYYSSNLLLLDLSSNKLVGGVPESLCNLQMLDLRSNAFNGSIPRLSSLPSLRILDLSNNNLSGTIPQSFGDFRSEIKYTTSKQLSIDTLIDLSNNYLSGNIPEELGNLHGLRSLNLSGNYLIGQIPRSIDVMKQLEVLDLSRNNLSGAIPSGLATLNFLDHLNLSYNNLSGSIPTGNQLQTFTDPSIYIGNPYLCGPPLPINCTVNIAKAIEEEQNEDSSESKMETLWLYTSITLGFITGFWLICGSLLLRRTWRITYFRAIDNMIDKLYVVMVVTVAKYRRKL
ncbi:unnamed protein product [Musa acuminata subsp. malaccensis]|nr:unnamed protein product [Musa acuminata subsp. malaccensis]